jgi:hypothetical protein
MLVDLKDRVNVEAEYQRGDVWSRPQQRLLIDSLLRGYDLPKIYLKKNPEGSSVLYDVIDGKQRLTALWQFFEDGYKLSSISKLSEPLGDLAGKTWSELSGPAQDRLQFATITVSLIESATDEQVRELFLRLQEGEPLDAAEKRNAMAGPVRDFVADELINHPVFSNLGIRQRRYNWHELAAIALLLVRAQGRPTTLKGADLHDLYADSEFDPNGEDADRLRSLLDDLAAITEHSPGAIRTRWGFVDLLLCLMHMEEADIEWEPARVSAFYVSFEDERKDSSTSLAEWRAEVSEFGPAAEDVGEAVPPLPEVQPDMFVYVQSFAREGATAENVQSRYEVMHKRLVSYLAQGD